MKGTRLLLGIKPYAERKERERRLIFMREKIRSGRPPFSFSVFQAKPCRCLPQKAAKSGFVFKAGQQHHKAKETPNLPPHLKSNGKSFSRLGRIVLLKKPLFSEQDKGSMLPGAAYSRKTAPGNTVRKVKKVC